MSDDLLRLGKVLDKEVVTRVVQIMGRTSAASPGHRHVVNRNRVFASHGPLIEADVLGYHPGIIGRKPWAELRINQTEMRYYQTARDDLLWLCGLAESLAARLDRAETEIAKHDARVTELLEANNREVERRRAAERQSLKVTGVVTP
jgi:hypothetical protein